MSRLVQVITVAALVLVALGTTLSSAAVTSSTNCPVFTPRRGHKVNVSEFSNTTINATIDGTDNLFSFGFCNQNPPAIGPTYCGFEPFVGQYLFQEGMWNCIRGFDFSNTWTWNATTQVISNTFSHSSWATTSFLTVNLGCGTSSDMKVLNATSVSHSDGVTSFTLNIGSSRVCKK